MEILFDQGTPFPLQRELKTHTVQTTFQLGWSELANVELLAVAEGQFDIFITTDQNLKHEQNLVSKRVAIVVLMTTSWPRIQRQISRIHSALEQIKPGQYLEVFFDE